MFHSVIIVLFAEEELFGKMAFAIRGIRNPRDKKERQKIKNV